MVRSKIKSKNQDKYEVLVKDFLDSNGIKYQAQYKWLKGRRFIADFYLEEFNCLLEINGGIHMGFGHGGGDGLARDYEKYTRMSWEGYKIIILCTNDFTSRQETVVKGGLKVKKYFKRFDKENLLTEFLSNQGLSLQFTDKEVQG